MPHANRASSAGWRFVAVAVSLGRRSLAARSCPHTRSRAASEVVVVVARVMLVLAEPWPWPQPHPWQVL